MCLGIQMRIKKIEGDLAMAQADGIRRKVNIQFLKNAKVGDYVIIHAGFAIEKVDEKRAKETLGLFREMGGSYKL